MKIRSDPRRFPPPWRAEPIPAGQLIVDATGTKLAYVYGVDPRAQTSMAGSLTFAQAEMIAAAITQLPDVLREGRQAPALSVRMTLTVEESSEFFRVRDAGNYGVATIYFVDKRAGDLTWDEARRIAANVAKLPASGA
jgi:hypothetical protein